MSHVFTHGHMYCNKINELTCSICNIYHHCLSLIHNHPMADVLYLLLQWLGISLPSGRPRKFLDLLSPLSCPHPSISDPSLYSHPVAAVSAPSVARHLSPFTKAQKISQPSTTTVLPLSITTQWLLSLLPWPGISLTSGWLRKFLDSLQSLSSPHPSISDPSLYNCPMAAVSGSFSSSLLNLCHDDPALIHLCKG